MSSLFAPKDAKAVTRGRMSVKARKKKAQEVPDNEDDGIAVISTKKISSVQGSHFVLIDELTGEKSQHQRLNPAGVEAMVGKTMSLDQFLENTRNSSQKLEERVFGSQIMAAELKALDLKSNATLFPEIVN